MHKKQIVPVLVVLGLILIISGFIIGNSLIEKYTPTDERKDLAEYYNITEETQVAITLNHKILEQYATLIDGHVYLDFDFVHDMINSRFYWDANENILLYTTAEDVISAASGATRYMVGKNTTEYGRAIVKATGQSALIDLEFVKQYSDIMYEYFEDPSRLVLYNEWDEITVSTLKKDSEVRLKGGIKSPILTNVKKGDTLTILEMGEDWATVCTTDGIVGYIKTSFIKNTEQKTLESDYVKETFQHISLKEPINLLWDPIYNTSGNDGIQSTLTNTKGVNVICPSWFKLKDNEGNLTSYASLDYVNYCHSQGVQVWGMVKNLDISEGVDINYILTHTSARQNLVNKIVARAMDYNLDGINIDFEQLSESKIGDGYIQFLRELSTKCEDNHIILSTAVYTPASYNSVYKYGEQADFVDYIALMTYDQHYGQASGEGSVAGLDWVENGIQNTLAEGVPANQILMGVPFYTKLWKLTPTSDDSATEVIYQITFENLGLSSAKKWMDNNINKPTWLEDCGQWYGELKQDTIIYKMWLEDNDSIEKKLQLANTYELAGAAYWSDDLDNTGVWEIIIKYIN